MSSVAAGLALVRSRIGAIAKELNLATPPTLVAVSKTMPSSVVMEAYNEGQRHLGENYVQEICEKAPELPGDIKWHFIGHLQSNKAKMLIKSVPSLYMVESVDSTKCATALDKACESVGRKELLHVMVQVNTSQEDSKSGCDETNFLEVVDHVLKDCKRLKFSGLMTIGKLGDPNPEPYFAKLARCRSEVVQRFKLPEQEVGLSMGMSGDYELAMRMGSTNVRVGSTIFGSRPAKPAAAAPNDASAAAGGGGKSPRGRAAALPLGLTAGPLDPTTAAAAAVAAAAVAAAVFVLLRWRAA